MGSCVSVQKGKESSMKVRLSFGSKSDNLVTPSPAKDKTSSINGDTVGVKSLWSKIPELGNKEEAFFDSKPWLDSDCEDDFFSVNGDFTPSRGSTPVHHSSTGAIKVQDIFEGINPGFSVEPSPSEKKKRLFDLFKESQKSDQESTFNLPSKPANGTPYSEANSVNGSERTPSEDLKLDEKSARSAQCCLPRMLSSRSHSERKKKTSPPHNTV